MTRYAAQTDVSSEKSRNEIEATLRRYGCYEFAYSTGRDQAAVGFHMRDLSIRFTLPMPDPNEFLKTSTGRTRHLAEKQNLAWGQAVRQRWRALALAIKAKLEAVECGITMFEEEFLAHVVTSNGRTIGDQMVSRLTEITGGAPLLVDMRQSK